MSGIGSVLHSVVLAMVKLVAGLVGWIVKVGGW